MARQGFTPRGGAAVPVSFPSWRKRGNGRCRRSQGTVRVRACPYLARRTFGGFEGTVDGTLVWPPRGDRGFGYDPVSAEGDTGTYGEIDPMEKHARSSGGCIPQVDRRLFSARLTRASLMPADPGLVFEEPCPSMHREASAFMCTGRSAFPNVHTATLIRTLLKVSTRIIGGPASWLSWIITEPKQRSAPRYGFLRWWNAVFDAACYGCGGSGRCRTGPLPPISKSPGG